MQVATSLFYFLKSRLKDVYLLTLSFVGRVEFALSYRAVSTIKNVLLTAIQDLFPCILFHHLVMTFASSQHLCGFRES